MKTLKKSDLSKMERKMTILKNTFHNTECKTRKTLEELDLIENHVTQGEATPSEMAFVRRIRNKLCGMADCLCGDFWGRRY